VKTVKEYFVVSCRVVPYNVNRPLLSANALTRTGGACCVPEQVRALWRGENALRLADGRARQQPSHTAAVVFQELDQHSSYVDVTTDMAVHADAVQVAYFPENETVVTCSQDPSAALVICHVAARRTPYIFKLARVGNRIQVFRIQILPTLAFSRFSYIFLGMCQYIHPIHKYMYVRYQLVIKLVE
jgi:hypothetical protein